MTATPVELSENIASCLLGDLIVPERLGNGLSGIGELPVAELFALAENGDASEHTSMDSISGIEDYPNPLCSNLQKKVFVLFRMMKIAFSIFSCW
ncbi:hypothetical protein TNIN_274041 [Trichonephila inaurata madagascariensis]|uniref:Uncharacterized protein n=1 Tax=Trichonephila inaurata madagascariensis TaxID=2747483 RepID=A0A8X6XAA1_9ARAC|nr:hypothetical protein TNIN_274041 [Trichonephila inaurata madagascariensis]